MTTRLAINGFGRIGRNILRALIEQDRSDLQVVAINDLSSTENLAHLLKYDSVHGRYPGKISFTENSLNLGYGDIEVTFSRPATQRRNISTPAQNASSFLRQAKVLIRRLFTASITTRSQQTTSLFLTHLVLQMRSPIHAYTGDQPTLDAVHRKDYNRGRAAAMSMIPTSTGAAKAISLVIPELSGKLDGKAIRVPTPNVSVVDLVVNTNKAASADVINAAFKKAAAGPLKGVLQVVEDKTVSIDFNHDPHSSSVVLEETVVMGEKLVRVLSWYDNEWGFSNRMLDTAAALSKFL